MKRFELIEHTADTGFVAYGHNLAGAFANAAYGLFSIIADLRRVRAVESREMTVSAGDVEELLFNWLNQLIYVFEVERLLFKGFDISEFTGRSLKATCRGEKYDPARHQLKIGVKSATYHMLKVDAGTNSVRVIFDI